MVRRANPIDLLGGAERKRPRVRGFSAWRPREESRVLLEQVENVLEEYADHLPLTLRQIFYRLVGAHDYEKTERAYNRLSEMLNRARRARAIDMDAIRDDGGTVIEPPDTWSSVEGFLATYRHAAQAFRLDHTEGQETRLVVLCEATGMAPQLARVADHYGIMVMSSGGFDSTTEKHRFAEDIAGQDRPTEVLHIGDHDPSGTHLFLAYLEDVEAFAHDLGGEATFTRLAVTPEQISQYRLATAPPKEGEKRAFSGQTCQAEALAPDLLSDILRNAIEERTNMRVLDRVIAREREARRELLERLGE
jgi:hypothetical protein